MIQTSFILRCRYQNYEILNVVFYKRIESKYLVYWILKLGYHKCCMFDDMRPTVFLVGKYSIPKTTPIEILIQVKYICKT